LSQFNNQRFGGKHSENLPEKVSVNEGLAHIGVRLETERPSISAWPLTSLSRRDQPAPISLYKFQPAENYWVASAFSFPQILHLRPSVRMEDHEYEQEDRHGEHLATTYSALAHGLDVSLPRNRTAL
jgi:hypothetical protein